MSTNRSIATAAVFSVANVAGMIDMVLLPLWIGTLVSHYGYDPAQAGITVTAFLLGAVLASVTLAPLFTRVPRRPGVVLGYALAGVTFFVLAHRTPDAVGLPGMAGLHALAGIGVGTGLSITLGTIGRSANPHRLFAIVNVALGAFGVLTYATLPRAIQADGPGALFAFLAAVMAVACVVCAVAFPSDAATSGPMSGVVPVDAAGRPHPVPTAAWLVVGTVMCLAFNQAMVFSFFSQIGAARGFAEGSVATVLIAVGLVNLVPGALAALLQRRLPPVAVGLGGPIVQAALALVISNSTSFIPYALAGAIYVAVVIFTHTFLFGLLSRIDISGRCVAATPAMMMTGSCIGPAAAGMIAASWGYAGIGWAALFVSLVAVCLLSALRLNHNTDPALAPVRL